MANLTVPPRFDPDVPHPARVYNVWLGGKDHYPADRKAAAEVASCRPQVVAGAQANRSFLARAVRYLAGQRGIRQFLDIGTGLPAPDSTNQVAQAIAPQSRIVYVDNDPLVLAHARALLTSTPEGACDYLDADLRDPAVILAEAARTLDRLHRSLRPAHPPPLPAPRLRRPRPADPPARRTPDVPDAATTAPPGCDLSGSVPGSLS